VPELEATLPIISLVTTIGYIVEGQSRLRNEEVRQRTNLKEMNLIIKERRLRGLGHLLRMEDDRIPKQRKCRPIAVNGIPSHSYGVSLAIWDHTVLPDTSEHTLP